MNVKKLAIKIADSVDGDSPKKIFKSLLVLRQNLKDYFKFIKPYDFVKLIFLIYSLKVTGSFDFGDDMIDKLRFLSIIYNDDEHEMVHCEDCNDGRVECSDCEGSGNESCTHCDGTGKIDCDTCGGSGNVSCEHCDGTGSVGDEDCTVCNGSGEVKCDELACEGGQLDCGWCDEGNITCSNCDGNGTFYCETCDASGQIEGDDWAYSVYCYLSWNEEYNSDCVISYQDYTLIPLNTDSELISLGSRNKYINRETNLWDTSDNCCVCGFITESREDTENFLNEKFSNSLDLHGHKVVSSLWRENNTYLDLFEDHKEEASEDASSGGD